MTIPLRDTQARIIWRDFSFFFLSFLRVQVVNKKKIIIVKKKNPQGSFLSLHGSFVMDLIEAPSLNDGSLSGDISGWSNPGGPTVY